MNAADITYDLLATGMAGYTTHIRHFRTIFDTMAAAGAPCRTLFECGCGYSTKYFLDRCQHVVSVEFVTTGTDAAWLDKCQEMYTGIANWTAVEYGASAAFSRACGHQCSEHTDYSLIDPTYRHELGYLFDGLLMASHLAGRPVDVAFVDAGVYIRGDMVEELLRRHVPVVVAHDYQPPASGETKGLYGWYKVGQHDTYERIHLPGESTCVWVSKSLDHVIEALHASR